MQAVILAAGRGTRLKGVIDSKPKCMASLDETSLLEYQLTVLRGMGINEICVVLGYRASLLKSLVTPQCDFVVNDRFAETNSLYSLWLARHWVRGDFLVCNADLLAHPEVYRRLLDQPGSALAYDSCSGEHDEHMKVQFSSTGNLRAIDKTLPPRNIDGENLGLLKFDGSLVSRVFSEATICLKEDGETQWAPAVVNRLCQSTRFCGVDVTDLPWVEIDFPEDLQWARESIWPKIRDTAGLGILSENGGISS